MLRVASLTTLRNVYILTSGPCKYASLIQRKEILQAVIKLEIVSAEISLVCPGESNVISAVKRGQQERHR